MTDYQKYINALRKCAKENENNRTSTGHIIVSDLCRDTANLLEKLSSSEKSNKSEIPKNSPTETLVSLDTYNQVAKERDIAIQQLHELGYEFGQKIEPTTKNDLGVDCRSLEDIKKLIESKADDLDGVMLDASGVIIGLYFAIANDLSPVAPIRPKGYWIDIDETHSKCSRCGAVFEIYSGNGEAIYCPNCRSDNREVSE